MGRSVIKLTVVIIILFGLGGISVCAADAVQVTAEGYGDIIDGDTARARDEALRDAYRRAIEIAGTQVDALTEVRDFQVFYDQVVTRASGYLRSYEITAEEEDEKTGLFRVEIEAQVIPANIREVEDRQALARLLELAGNPVVMVLGDEKTAGAALGYGLVKDLGEWGYHVVDPEQTKKIWLKETPAEKQEEVEAAVNFAERFDADIVLLISAETSRGGTYENAGLTFYGGQARVSIRAASTWTGRVLKVWEEERTEPGGSYDRAKERAITRALEKLSDDIVWELPGYAGGAPGDVLQVRITLENVSSFSQARELESEIEVLRGVYSLYFRSFDQGTLTLDLELELSMEDFAVRLEDLDAFDLRVISLGRESLRVEVK